MYFIRQRNSWLGSMFLYVTMVRMKGQQSYRNLSITKDIVSRRPIIQSQEFYDKEGKKRNYFYSLDSRGRVFLANTKHRNYATSYKDRHFLNLLYRNLRLNNTGEFLDYPYYSLCGKEKNFLCCDDPLAAVVFDSLQVAEESNNDTTTTIRKDDSEQSAVNYHLLIQNTNIKEQFDPSKLAIGTDRLYHPITSLKHMKGCKALLHPTIAEQLSLKLSFENNNVVFNWENSIYTVEQID